MASSTTPQSGTPPHSPRRHLNLERVLDLSFDAIVLRDAQDRIEYWNRGASELYGYSEEEALGRVTHELLRTEFPVSLAQIRLILERTGRWTGEVTQTAKDGRRVIVSSRWSLKPDDDGSGVAVLETNRDITEQKRAEEALRGNEQRLQFHVENTPLALIEWGPDFQLTRWSGEAERLFGWRADEVLGRRMDEFRWIHADDQAFVAQIAAGLLDGTRARSVSCNRNYRKDGSVVYCEWYNSSIVDGKGQLVSIFSLVLDVTERKHTEELLRHSEERYRRVFEHAATGIAITDFDGKFIQCNPAYEAILGYTEEELRNLNFSSLVHPDDVASNLDATGRLKRGEVSSFTVENRYVRKSGEAVWVQKFVSVLSDPTGKPGFVLALVSDIGDRRRTQEQLQRSEQQYRNLFENMTEEVHLWKLVRDASGQIQTWRLLDANPAALKTWNVAAVADVKGKTCDQIFGEGTTEHFRPVVEKITAQGLPCAYEDYFEKLEKYFRFTSVPFGDLFMTTGADITVAKRAEQALQAREAEFRMLANAIPQLSWMANPDGWIFWYNDRWYEYTGTRPEDMQGWGWQSVHDPEVLPEVLQRWKAAIASGEQFEMVFPLRGHDGVFRPFLTRVMPVKDEQRKVVRWFGTNTDITKQKEAEQVLAETAANFSALVNSIPQIVWTCNETGQCDYLSDRWLNFTGATLEESLGYGWVKYLHPDDRPRAQREWESCVATRTNFQTEFRIRRSDGEYRWFLTRATPFVGQHGELKWFGTNTDITVRKSAEEELRLSRERIRESEFVLRATFENAGVGIAHLGLDGRWLRFNDRMCAITGYSREQLLTKTFAEITHPEDIEADWTKARTLIAGEAGSYDMDKRYVRPDGSIVWVHLTVSMLRDRAGKAQSFIAVVEDITRRKLAEAALIRSEKLAAAGQLASTIAHEINNPLEAVTNLLYLVKNDPGLSGQLREYVEVAEGEVHRVSQMARRTLSFFRSTSVPGRYSVSQVVEDVLRVFAPILSGHDIAVTKRLDARAEVVGLASEIRQVCTNLISNAIDADTKSIAVRVSRRTCWKADGEYAVRITVADTGHGIPGESLRRIFEPFYTTKHLTGTGLGLWVCWEIVRNHGGTVRVRSKPGKGSVFSVYLPTGEEKLAGAS